MNEWWKTFFDQDYLTIAGQMFSEETSAKQAGELWSMLDLEPGCRLLDAPCGSGRLSRPLAQLGAIVLGVDQSKTLLSAAESQRGDLLPEQLLYLKHDLRTPVPQTDFDVRLQYLHVLWIWNGGRRYCDISKLASGRPARRSGNCGDEPSGLDVCFHCTRLKVVDADAGRHDLRGRTNFRRDLRRSEPQLVLVGTSGLREKHAQWRCYTPTQIVGMLERAGLRFAGAYKGLSKTPFNRGTRGRWTARCGCDSGSLTCADLRYCSDERSAPGGAESGVAGNCVSQPMIA